MVLFPPLSPLPNVCLLLPVLCSVSESESSVPPRPRPPPTLLTSLREHTSAPPARPSHGHRHPRYGVGDGAPLPDFLLFWCGCCCWLPVREGRLMAPKSSPIAPPSHGADPRSRARPDTPDGRRDAAAEEWDEDAAEPVYMPDPPPEEARERLPLDPASTPSPPPPPPPPPASAGRRRDLRPPRFAAGPPIAAPAFSAAVCAFLCRDNATALGSSKGIVPGRSAAASPA
jgi:hypothetical protein